jgi:hypothetical protein
MRFLLPVAIASAFLAGAARGGEADRTVRKNPFIDGQYDVYDGSERRVGTVRANPFIADRYDLYDAEGRRTGELRGSPFVDGEWKLDSTER